MSPYIMSWFDHIVTILEANEEIKKKKYLRIIL